MRGLVWFRNDLRINDNSALFHASRECRDGLIALHCIPKNLDKQAHFNQRQYSLLQQQLNQLEQALAKLNIQLVIKSVDNINEIENVILDLMQTYQLETLYYNNRYELAQRTADKHLNALLEKNQRTVKHYTDHLIAPPEKLLTPKDKPFTSLTAFKKTWQSFLRHAQIHPLGAVEKQALALKVDHNNVTFASQDEITPPWSLDENLAQDLLAPEHTDQLNILFSYLTLGLVSPRQFIHTLLQAENVQHKQQVDKWLNLLIEREFDHHIMFHFPHICDHRDFIPNMNSLPWNQDEKLLTAWQNGQTGYPLIDASMRCLNQTGYLPDELLQASALFFTKVLFMDYRLGEAYFAQKRIDYEFATNNALWQWSASTGAESVIYARIPQPSRQSEVYDNSGEFIRTYCPELASINAIGIHDPHFHARDVVAANGYPEPVVDYNTMRKKTIYHFKSLNKKLKSSDFVPEAI